MKKPVKIVLIVLGAPLALMVALAGLIYFGMTIFIDQAEASIAENTVVQYHIGTIEKTDFDFVASFAAEGEDTFGFSLVGTKGEGKILADFVTVDDETEEITNGTITLPNGKSYDLITGQEN